MSPYTFDEKRHRIWRDHATAMTFAQARALFTGTRQYVEPVSGHDHLAWHVRKALPARQSQRLGVVPPC